MLENREKQAVPNVILRTRREHEWVDVTSDEIFKGKTVVVFSLPGAFTPTCSSTHVPRYNQLTPVFKRHGVDEVICVSVNDAFVMNEWQREQQADRITFLPDGNGDFTRGMGMLVSKEELGFGDRSWRYSMLVKDGVIEKLKTSLLKRTAWVSRFYLFLQALSVCVKKCKLPPRNNMDIDDLYACRGNDELGAWRKISCDQ
ncbi:peroxiredoxin [Candidatus Thiodiazotropha sp. CDECU1]|uniref:peroxiredoxin n=1 Tax=Candidatus Thiodiazotropha sp. CDECU1 TaxID=3065865 RepID=UPI002930F943|nr:peroxiredoxin [Candidatus Thiodiazotropha sp. CDECU1]